MTDPSETPTSDELRRDLVVAVLEQAEEIAALDAARAEAWASDILALGAEAGMQPASLGDALAASGGDGAATALAALGGLVDGMPRGEWSAGAPPWVAAVGTSRCVGAWTLADRADVSVAFVFVDARDERHVITVDLVTGPPETVGEVVVGPGDLLDALQEDDAGIVSDEAAPPLLAARCVDALRVTESPTLSAVVNGRVLLRRLADLTTVDVDPPVAVDDEIPEPPVRDPDDDAFALEVLARAIGEPEPDADVDADVVDAVAEIVAPADLAPLSPSVRDAVLILEWADWLGAVIGLVRAGVGCTVDGAVMVDMVNRCPEVTTTIPKADRPRIEWAFDAVIASWDDLELVVNGRLTALGVAVLPAALRRAWG